VSGNQTEIKGDAMPGPDPHRFWIEETENGYSVFFQAYDWTGNNGNRKARALAVLKRLRRGTWRCQWCGDFLPDHLRADALYCGEQCRKRAARTRREARRAQTCGCWPLT
jgi:hypothetical protein